MRETSHTETQRTVEEYLRGCVGFDIEDNAIATILEDRGIAPGTPSKELTRKQKELCKADLYMWCASTPSIKGSVGDLYPSPVPCFEALALPSIVERATQNPRR